MIRSHAINLRTALILLILVLPIGLVRSADAWPGPLPGASISANLPVGYEPSGAVWHPRLGKLFTVSDGGFVPDGADPEPKNRLQLVQRVNGMIKAKAGVAFRLTAFTLYDTSIAFDGSFFTVSVNGTAVLTMPKAPGTTPFGAAGFGVKKGSGRLAGFSVCE